ncbi:polymorphic toxin-type HINT domain-containing protein [Capnocytophaga canimorsus]|uniref:polymorphic toxin-type HINT domain-containing protein n=1 Tax=Capnocytophaga canimorsus TaxID=28188 RepID=UPI001EDCAC7C|nr:polymorphic toxin-type HINT domain-containing protein [Capnocytophaga canimorsus]GJQ05046.1 hypothetical protein CAPN009_14610 [Capnocytophaga canimorsus]
MPNELEYIVDKAVVVCDNGAKPNFFNATNNQKVKIGGCKVSIASDKAPMVNIPEFGICALTNKPCVPVPTEWQDTYKVKINGEQTLLYKSKLPCSAGGTITFSTSGQVPLSQEDLDEMVEQHGEDPEESSWGWWDTAELIPVVGSVIGMVREANKGNWGMVALNAGFLVLDVLGFVSFGATTAVATTAKTGVKAGIKATAKKTIQTAMKTAKNATTKILGKQGIKTAAKALATKVDDIAKAHGKICIFACFPAGTPVHTQSGIKNIEDIQIGDWVWAYDEDTEQVQLQRVTATFEREVDATLQIVLEGEVIETTAEHPFYTQQGWKDAGDLTTIDHIKTQNHQWQRIKGHNFLYQTKKVYNFEVENWHTYFVGLWALLVHNVCKYASKILAQNIDEVSNWWLWGRASREVLREALSKVMNMVGKEAHHLIPVNLVKNDEIIKKAIKEGFDFHGLINGRGLTQAIHRDRVWGHTAYDKYVKATIERFSKEFPEMSSKDLLEKKVIPQLNEAIDEAEKVGKTLSNYVKEINNTNF